MSTLTSQDKERLLSYLETRLEPKVYDTWCRGLELEPAGDNAFRVPTANPFTRDWLERLLRRPLEEAFVSVFGSVPTLVFHVAPGLVAPAAPPPPPAALPAAPARPADPESAARPEFVFNPNYVFESYIQGPSNRMAYAAAVAVSENPAQLYNPLFIHGGVGLGKTHLLQAICHEILRRNPEARVQYLSCEDFVNGYIYAIQRRTLETFRARYRNADVLVVDDIHFLTGKEQSQEEFFHTFNALHLAGKQVVLSSDQPAAVLKSLTQQLLSRFKMGFEIRIMPPPYETRLAILRGKAAARGVDLPLDVLGYISSVVESNIRELEGALTKVLGYAALSKRPIDLALAQEVLRETPAQAPAARSIAEIQQAVARYYQKKVSDFQARRWTKSTSLARQVCIYLCRKLTSSSLEELGNHFGGKDHSTILYSIRKVERLALDEPGLRADLERLQRELGRP
jgi:chromosomal replication initiator protein